MPNKDGIQFIREVREIDNKVPIIIVTAQASIYDVSSSITNFIYIPKLIKLNQYSQIMKRLFY